MKYIARALFTFVLLAQNFSHAQELQFPLDGVVNILDYYPTANDGQTDVTAYIQQAIDEHSIDLYRRFTLYFPAGTYLVSAPVFVDTYSNTNGGNGKGIIFQGEGKDETIIKLTDNNALFQNPSAPLPVLSNAGNRTNETWTAIAFMNSIFDLTLDVGSGNPGAIGIRYISNNQGSLKRVRIQSSDIQRVGWAGIDMERASIPGPALIKDVEIIGFDYSIRVASANYGTTIEHVTLKEARQGGIRSSRHILNIRGLKTEGINGPAIQNLHPDGMLTMIESDLSGSDSDAAIINQGNFFLRDIEFSGYSNSLNHFGELISTPIEELYFPDVIKLWDESPNHSLRLPIEETPELPYDAPENWVNITDFGYTPGTVENPNYQDVGPAIRAAIAFMNEPGNEDKTTIYFEPGEYRLASPVEIYGNIKRVVGNFASIWPQPEIEKTTVPIFTIQDTDYEILVIERINFAPVCCNDRRRQNAFFLNNSSRDVVLQHVYIGHGKAYEKGSATGKLFLEDVCALSQYYYIHSHREEVLPEAIPQFDFKDQHVWARQFDPEQRHTKISTNGGKVWILGLKSEEPGIVIHARDLAEIEVLGGTILPSFPIQDSVPVIKIENASGSFTLAEHAGIANFTRGGFYKRLIEENRGQEMRKVSRGEIEHRLKGDHEGVFLMPLYVAHGGPRVMPSYEIAVNETIDFGEVIVGETKNQILTLRNTGNSTLSIERILYPESITGNDTTFEIAAGTEKQLSISYSPETIGDFLDSIVIRSDAATSPSRIYTTGKGLATRVLATTGLLVFSETIVGDTSVRTLTIKNEGLGPLTVSDILLPQGFSVDVDSLILLPDSSQELTFRFHPTEAILYAGTLEIKSDATSGNAILNIAGRGANPPLSITPSEVLGKLSFFPNPTEKDFHLTLENQKFGTIDITILDPTGRTIYQETYTKDNILFQHTFSTAQWPAGIYYIMVRQEHLSLAQRILLTTN